MENEHFLRRTKIVATLGPATSSPKVIADIIRAGVNVVRLNFSHGTHLEHKNRIDTVRAEAAKQNRIVGILADLQGPKIRVASFVDHKVILNAGDNFVLDAGLENNAGTCEKVGIDYKELPNDVSAGDFLLLDDGRLTLKVDKVNGAKIHCKVIVGGVLSDHKGINRQGGGLSAKALTDKDKDDLNFVVGLDVEYIAISFPRTAEDVNEAKKLVKQAGGSAAIIAKIERAEAVEHIADIIKASDGVMVARGDLAVEIGEAEVPIVQKDIIHRARHLDRPVIIATQMMESMIQSTVPTRAEVSDVANAVMENTDAVMLSAETAVGQHPVTVVKTMSRICLRAETQRRYQVSKHRSGSRFQRIDEAVAMATMFTANHFNIAAVIALTESGATTLWMSRVRTAMPIYGLSRQPRTLGRMALYRGVYPIYFDVTKSTRDDVNREAVAIMEKRKVLQKGDLVILTKGDHQGVGGGSNAMKILKVGEII
ncbi:MAG: pyruvate kinase [Gammaproteobacteria bacterium]|nr:pyruvate kinase [Gammaproteobacteria bacterium]